ncbi:MAG: hypothetical protein AVDCRST_MAG93-8735 [uncultured Chloroflexia bacterium]|uniref:Uncharacterized protein n=1 Tax=uncultured Chloroflexia bacterium TaxID=1672391 RepID=A0A6J4N4U0_9CHLR|nr:MAG: hypothetical protein AVDCRST_MAG93-8735 [uncultured Chloroflexia bacterium]
MAWKVHNGWKADVSDDWDYEGLLLAVATTPTQTAPSSTRPRSPPQTKTNRLEPHQSGR